MVRCSTFIDSTMKILFLFVLRFLFCCLVYVVATKKKRRARMLCTTNVMFFVSFFMLKFQYCNCIGIFPVNCSPYTRLGEIESKKMVLLEIWRILLFWNGLKMTLKFKQRIQSGIAQIGN